MKKNLILVLGIMIFLWSTNFVLATTVSLGTSETDNWPGYTLDTGITAITNNTAATDELNEPAVTDPTFPLYGLTHTLWYKFQPATNDFYVATTCAIGGSDTVVNLYEEGVPNTLTNLVGIAGEDGVSVGTPCGLSAAVEYYLESGKTYYYQVGSKDGTNLGEIDFSIYPIYPVVIEGVPWSTSSTGSTFVAHVLAGLEPAPLTGVQFQLESGSWTACSADDGLFDIMNDVEAGSCTITGLVPGQINNINFRGVGTSDVVTQPSGYLHLALDVASLQGNLTLTNKSQYLSNSGNFIFSGVSSGNGQIVDVMWRQYILGQAVGVGWSGCSPDDGNFDTSSENYTCTIPTPQTDGTYNYEIKTDDSMGSTTNHVFPVGLIDRANKVDAWFNFTNITNGGLQIGVSRSFGSVAINGTPTLTLGKYEDGAATFDGLTWLEMGDTVPFLDYAGSNRNFSIKTRIKPSLAGSGTNRIILFKQAPDLDSSYWMVWIDNDGKIESRMQIGVNNVSEDNNNSIQSVGAVNFDNWNDIEVNWDVANRIACIKLNNELGRCTAWLHPQAVFSSTGSLFIGGAQSTPYAMANFLGEIDDVQVDRTGDATPPVIQISPLGNGDRVTTKTPSLTISFNDNNGGVASAEYYVSTATIGSSLNSWESIVTPNDGQWGGVGETATVVLPPLDDGVATIYVRSHDLNGNTNVNFEPYTSNFFEASSSFNIETVDTTAPRIYANAVQPNPLVDKQPAIRGYVKDYLQLNSGDTASNIAQILYNIDGGSFSKIDTIDGNFDSLKEDFYFKLPTELAVGQHTIEIRAIDAAGNSTANNPVDGLYGDVTLTFTVDSQSESTVSQTITKTITFDNHDLHDSIFSDAIWGNGVVRLRQKINFSELIDYTPIDYDTYGYTFGDSSLGVFESIDGNLWIAGTDGSITYYNTTNKTTTKYNKDLFKGESGRIYKIFEFEDLGNRYLLINFKNELTSMIYNINNTPENVADDPAAADFASEVGFPANYGIFNPYSIDTRGAHLAIYGTMDGNLNGGSNVIRIDLNGTPMNLTDDSYTVWGHPQGLGDDSSGNAGSGFTSFYFDQGENKFLAFQDSFGLYVCGDNGTPTNLSDDSCSTPWEVGAVPSSSKVFSVIKDPNGWYWVGGDDGLVRMKINGTVTRTDDTFEVIFASSDIAGDQISALKWIPGVAPVGDEVWAMTRQGRIRAIEYNSTYNDSLDDTTYSYKINKFDYRSGSTSTFYMQNRNTIWVGVPGQGLDKIALDRTYEDSNTIEIFPVPPANLLEINHVELSDVMGFVSVGSSYTFGDLVTYEVSNDAGVTWKNANIGDVIDFSTSDYKLKIRVTLHKGSTPILQSLSLSYLAQPSGTIALLNIPPANNASNNNSGGNNNNSGSQGGCNDPKPSKAPDLFQINARSTSAKTYFSPLADTNVYYLAYSIKPIAEEHGTYTTVTLSREGVQNFTLNLLKPNTIYYVKVRGQIGCMPGDWSNVMKIMTQPKGSLKTKDYYKNMVSRLITPVTNVSKTFSKMVTQVFNKPTINSSPTMVQAIPTTVEMIPNKQIVKPTVPIVRAPTTVPAKKTCFLWWCF